ncbi:MAG: hypothetical protein JST35_02390 [Armatimonadetes bacterium]|nr:hypothetical protein [Armatimonadota bacterium]
MIRVDPASLHIAAGLDRLDIAYSEISRVEASAGSQGVCLRVWAKGHQWTVSERQSRLFWSLNTALQSNLEGYPEGWFQEFGSAIFSSRKSVLYRKTRP